MAKVGYNNKEPSGLGKLIHEASRKRKKAHDLTKTQKMLKAKSYGGAKFKVEIRYASSNPIYIPIQKANVLVFTIGVE